MKRALFLGFALLAASQFAVAVSQIADFPPPHPTVPPVELAEFQPPHLTVVLG